MGCVLRLSATAPQQLIHVQAALVVSSLASEGDCSAHVQYGIQSCNSRTIAVQWQQLIPHAQSVGGEPGGDNALSCQQGATQGDLQLLNASSIDR